MITDGCSFLRSSSVYQQGEAVFWEARVEAPEHSPLTVYVDSCVATLKRDPLSVPSYKFIPKHGWCTTEGDSALCQCCDADCSDLSAEKNSGYTGHAPQPQTERKHKTDKTIGPVHTLQPFHWKCHLSITGNPFFQNGKF